MEKGSLKVFVALTPNSENQSLEISKDFHELSIDD